MNDKEKLDTWNQICMEHGWSAPNELEKWLLHSGVKFSNSGSAVPNVIMMIENKYNLDIVIKASEGEQLATYILQVLTGMLVFPSIDLERLFWSWIDQKLRKEFNTSVPQHIIPNYIKNYNEPKQYDLFS